jgi:ketosteroid isomerase-like protein
MKRCQDIDAASLRGRATASLRRLLVVVAVAVPAGCATPAASPDRETARAQVRAAELAFARTMAERDLRSFGHLVSDEAVFFGAATPLRGKVQVLEGWARYFEGPAAPFSWEPDEVEVLPSGTLALSSGPVRDADGQLIARFTSVWRLEAPGIWRVVFDKGSPVCRPGCR